MFRDIPYDGFDEPVLQTLKSCGPIATKDLYDEFKKRYPELVKRNLGPCWCANDYTRWHHLIRNAQQVLKRCGSIKYDIRHRKWYVCEA